VPDTEEIAKRHQDRRVGVVVPGHPDQHLAVVVRVHDFPVHAERVVHLDDRGSLRDVDRVEEGRADRPPGELGHEDVSDGPGAGQVGENARLPRADDPAVLVPAALIKARSSPGMRVAYPGQFKGGVLVVHRRTPSHLSETIFQTD
jgi:hypothetical protein